MSRIVSPHPPPLNNINNPTTIDARWWRLHLTPNDEANYMVFRTNATDDTPATWMEWEFFDGHHTVLDAGMDKPNVYRAVLTSAPLCVGVILDLLCVDQPTPSPDWDAITKPGNHYHPGFLDFRYKITATLGGTQ